MIAALICVMSLGALIQFAVAEWRSIWITIAAQPLSNALESATGIANNDICADHFEMLIHVSRQISAAPRESNIWLREVRVYHRLVRTCLKLGGAAVPPVSNWAKRELAECSKFVAVVLDRRLTADLAYSVEGRRL